MSRSNGATTPTGEADWTNYTKDDSDETTKFQKHIWTAFPFMWCPCYIAMYYFTQHPSKIQQIRWCSPTFVGRVLWRSVNNSQWPGLIKPASPRVYAAAAASFVSWRHFAWMKLPKFTWFPFFPFLPVSGKSRRMTERKQARALGGLLILSLSLVHHHFSAFFYPFYTFSRSIWAGWAEDSWYVQKRGGGYLWYRIISLFAEYIYFEEFRYMKIKKCEVWKSINTPGFGYGGLENSTQSGFDSLGELSSDHRSTWNCLWCGEMICPRKATRLSSS